MDIVPIARIGRGRRTEGRTGEAGAVDIAVRGPPTLRYNGQLMAGGSADPR